MSDEIQGPLRRPGDLIIHVESLVYCTKTATIRNPSGAAVVLNDIVGYPLIAGTGGADYDLAFAGDEANVVALLVDGPPGQSSETIAATTTSAKQYQVIHRPPAILNQDKIRIADTEGDDFNQATIQTALKALDFELRAEPTKYSEL